MDFECSSLVLDQMVIVHHKSPLFGHEWADESELSIQEKRKKTDL